MANRIVPHNNLNCKIITKTKINSQLGSASLAFETASAQASPAPRTASTDRDHTKAHPGCAVTNCTKSEIIDTCGGLTHESSTGTHLTEKIAKHEQPCWTCKHCGNSPIYRNGKKLYCPWVDRFAPVPGWDATPTEILSSKREENEKGELVSVITPSYEIHKCPLYEYDEATYVANLTDQEVALELRLNSTSQAGRHSNFVRQWLFVYRCVLKQKAGLPLDTNVSSLDILNVPIETKKRILAKTLEDICLNLLIDAEAKRFSEAAKAKYIGAIKTTAAKLMKQLKKNWASEEWCGLLTRADMIGHKRTKKSKSANTDVQNPS